MDVLAVKFVVKRPDPYYVPRRWKSYTYAKIFIDNELKGEWYVGQYGTFKKFMEKAKKIYKFTDYRYEHWGSENRNY